MDLVFLDASILFSAAYRSGSKLSQPWQLTDVRLMSSRYAVEEAHRNLEDPEKRRRLADLMGSVRVVPAAIIRTLPDWVDVPPKDAPILQAAIAAGATHLLTADFEHFGRYFLQNLEGVTILPPGAYLKDREKRFPSA